MTAAARHLRTGHRVPFGAPSPQDMWSEAGSEAPPRGAAMMLNALLALGLLLSTAPQLRLAGSSTGPGEICLVIWLVVMFCREVARFGSPTPPSPALSRLLLFWAFFAVAQSFGTLTGIFVGDVHDLGLFLHDVMAYFLLAALSCLCVVEPGAGPRLRQVAWLVAPLGAAFLGLQLAHAWGLVEIPQIDPWYWDRLRGWAAIPNQLALVCAVLAILSVHLAETATRTGQRIAAIVCAILPIYVGCLTKSDAFTLALLSSGVIFAALKFRAWLRLVERGVTFRAAFAWIAVFALPLLLVSALPPAVSMGLHAEGIAKDLAKDNGQNTGEEAALRFHLWNEAIDRGLESWMLGLGPGPHLKIPASIAAGREDSQGEPANIQHPKPGSELNFEAHSTPLDLFTQGGVIAVSTFVWLMATALLVTYRARLDALTTLLCTLGIFGMFHLIVRHPIFWFAIAFCLVAGAEAGKLRTAREGS
jgi:hypothetical protein